MLLLNTLLDSHIFDPYHFPGAITSTRYHGVYCLAGWLIWRLNRRYSFGKADISEAMAGRLSLLLAVFTAPSVLMMLADVPLKKKTRDPFVKRVAVFCRFTGKKFTDKKFTGKRRILGRFRLKAHRFEHSYQLAAVFFGRMDTAVHVFCTLHQIQRGGGAGIDRQSASSSQRGPACLRSREKAGQERGWLTPL